MWWQSAQRFRHRSMYRAKAFSRFDGKTKIVSRKMCEHVMVVSHSLEAVKTIFRNCIVKLTVTFLRIGDIHWEASWAGCETIAWTMRWQRCERAKIHKMWRSWDELNGRNFHLCIHIFLNKQSLKNHTCTVTLKSAFAMPRKRSHKPSNI